RRKVHTALLGETAGERARLDAVAGIVLRLDGRGRDRRLLGRARAIAFDLGRRRRSLVGGGLAGAGLAAVLRDRLLGRDGRRRGGAGILALAGEEGDDGADLHFVGAFGDQDLGDRAFVDRFE